MHKLSVFFKFYTNQGQISPEEFFTGELTSGTPLVQPQTTDKQTNERTDKLTDITIA